MQNKKCLAPGCKELAESRGLCNKHYHEAYYEVEIAKRTTWRKLENHKPPLAAPKGVRRNTGSSFRNAVTATGKK